MIRALREPKYQFRILLTTCLVLLVLYANRYHNKSEIRNKIRDRYRYDAERLPLQSMAIGIKTFLRPLCALQTIQRYEHFLPEVPIYVADDSYRNMSNPLKELSNIKYIELPEDTGVGYGRNRLVESILNDGYEFMILTDDDFFPSSREDLIRLVKYYFITKADIISGTRYDRGRFNGNSKGTIFEQHGHLYIYPDVIFYNATNVETCHRTDIIQSVMFAKTSTLLQRWDNNLKNNDHYDFLIAAKRDGLRLLSCIDVIFHHNKSSCQLKSEYSQRYKYLRSQRWQDLVPYVLKKWHLHAIDNEVGVTIALDSEGRVRNSKKRPTNITLNSSSDTLVTEVLKIVNSKRDAWRWYRLFYDQEVTRKGWLKLTRLSSCTEHVTGLLNVQYDRPTQYKNIMTVLPINVKLPQPTCDISHHLMQIISLQFITNNLFSINYIVSVTGDHKTNVKRLLTCFQTMRTYELGIGMNNAVQIVLVDMDSIKKLQQKHLQLQFPSLNISVISTTNRIDRAIALKRGIKYIKTRNNDSLNTIFFTADASLLLPKDFGLRLMTNVICGVTAYAPIVAKCLNCRGKSPMDYPKPKLIWMNHEMDTLGFCFSDYTLAGGYNDRRSTIWGAESIDLYDRILHHTDVLTVNRIQEEGFYHSAAKIASLAHSENKHEFNLTLPESTLSTMVTSEALLASLLAVLNKLLNTNVGRQNLIVVWQAYSSKQNVLFYTFLYKNVEQIVRAFVQYKY